MSSQQELSKEKLTVLPNIFHPVSSWYIFYLYPRSEKVVYSELIRMKYEVFLPTIKSLRLWNNRQKKTIEQVLFPGYIFVKTQVNELPKILKSPKVVTILKNNGKPSIINQGEIDGIKKMLQLDLDISIETNYMINEKVKIINGPFTGYEGVLVKQNGKTRFGIQLKEINYILSIEISPNCLEKI